VNWSNPGQSAHKVVIDSVEADARLRCKLVSPILATITDSLHEQNTQRAGVRRRSSLSHRFTAIGKFDQNVWMLASAGTAS
jgi:hypothetical protein